MSDFKMPERVRVFAPDPEWHNTKGLALICVDPAEEDDRPYLPNLPSRVYVDEARVAELEALVTDLQDQHHTMQELYEHRHALFAALISGMNTAWKSKNHHPDSDPMYHGWFVAGIRTPAGEITYHMPMEWWDRVYVNEVPHAPAWDGYTPDDVLQRLQDCTRAFFDWLRASAHPPTTQEDQQ